MTAVLVLVALVLLGGAAAAMALRDLIHSALCLVLAWTGIALFYLWAGAEFLAFAQVLIYMGGISILILFAIMLSRKLVGWDVLMTNRQSIPSAIAVLLFLYILIVQPWTVERDANGDGKISKEESKTVLGVIHTVDYSPEPSLTITKDMLEQNPEMAAAATHLPLSAEVTDPKTGKQVKVETPLTVQVFTDEEAAATKEKREPQRQYSTTNWYEPNSTLLGQSLMSTYTLIFWVASFILTAAMIGALYIARKEDVVRIDPRKER